MVLVSVPRGRRLVIEAGLFAGLAFAALLHILLIARLLGWQQDPVEASVDPLFLDTLAGLASVLLLLVSFVLLLQARSRLNTPRVPRRFTGGVLVGAGAFIAVDSVVVHALLQQHRFGPAGEWVTWELLLLGLGALFLLLGGMMLHRVSREAREQERGYWPPPPPRKGSEPRRTGERGLRGSRL